MSDAAAPANEVRASRFVLVDDEGKERAVLEMRKGQPIFQMLGANGRVQIQIGIIPEWDGVPHLCLESPDLSSLLCLAATKDGNAGIQLGASHRRVFIYSHQDGQLPTIELKNDQSQVIARIPENGIEAITNPLLQLELPQDLAGDK